jgi:glycosyltransferase 2 family protein
MNRILKPLVSLAFLTLSLALLDWNKLVESFAHVRAIVVFCVIVLICLKYFVMAMRWHQIMQKVTSMPALENLRIYFYATFLNFFTPANLGGDIYRLITLRSHTTPSFLIILALIQERLLGLLAFCIFYLACIVGVRFTYLGELHSAGRLFNSIGWFLLVGTVGILVLPYLVGCLDKWTPIRSRRTLAVSLNRFRQALVFNSCADFALLLGLSLLSLWIWISAVWIISRDLHIHVSWLVLAISVILAELIRLVPLSVQGIGLREGTFAYIFSLLGDSPEAGFTLGTISYLTLSCSLLISGLIAVCMTHFPIPRFKMTRSSDNDGPSKVVE